MIKKRGRGCERVIVLLIFSLVRIIGMVYSTDITSSHISHTFNFMRDNFKLIDLKKNGAERRQNFSLTCTLVCMGFVVKEGGGGESFSIMYGVYIWGEIYEPSKNGTLWDFYFL